MNDSIETPARKRLHLVAGRFNRPLTEDIAAHLGVELTSAEITTFANGEIHCRFADSIRGGDVFIVQSHGADECGSINDAIDRAADMVDAAKRASAKRVTVGRALLRLRPPGPQVRGPGTDHGQAGGQHVRGGGGQAARVDRPPLGQIQGFFDGPVDHLTAMPVLAAYMAELGEDIVVVSPDPGRVKTAERYAKQLHAGLAFVYKRRSAQTTVEALAVLGDVEGRTCVLIDDMIDTAGTMVAAAEQLIAAGAVRVLAAVTHGVLSDPAIDRLKNSPIERLVITDTLPLPPEKQIDKIEVLSVAPILANAIRAVFDDTSVSEIFDGNNLA